MGAGLGTDFIGAKDSALWDAGLGDYNMLAVSSVPPLTRITPKIVDGISYVPIPPKWNMIHDNVRPLIDRFQVKFNEERWLKLETSWTVNLIKAQCVRGKGQRATAAIGLGHYTSLDGTPGIFAVEHHSSMGIQETTDKCYEMLHNMITLRGRAPVKRLKTVGDDVEKVSIGKHVLAHLGLEEPVYNIKYTSRHPEYAMEVNVCTIEEMPEGMIGNVVSCVVFDPFTEINGVIVT